MEWGLRWLSGIYGWLGWQAHHRCTLRILWIARPNLAQISAFADLNFSDGAAGQQSWCIALAHRGFDRTCSLRRPDDLLLWEHLIPIIDWFLFFLLTGFFCERRFRDQFFVILIESTSHTHPCLHCLIVIYWGGDTAKLSFVAGGNWSIELILLTAWGSCIGCIQSELRGITVSEDKPSRFILLTAALKGRDIIDCIVELVLKVIGSY